MDKKEFKRQFGQIAISHGFDYLYSAWNKKSDKCMIILDLQKSNYSELYYLNIKVYIKGLFNEPYELSKSLIKHGVGDIFIRQPDEYSVAFDLESELSDVERIVLLEALFVDFLIPFSRECMTIIGIKNLLEKESIFLLPAVKNELYRVYPNYFEAGSL